VREAVAFANTEGGTLLIGIDDDKTIRGLKFASEDEFALDQAFKKHCFPELIYNLEKITLESEREILVYTIPKSNQMHRVIEDLEEPESSGTAYVRVSDMSVKASREMREILKGRVRDRDVRFKYGDKENILMKYLEAHNHITVDEFCQMAKIPRRIASRTLVLLVLAKVLEIEPQPQYADAFVRYEE
jgi:predicted HTH transcriptional regulator